MQISIGSLKENALLGVIRILAGAMLCAAGGGLGAGAAAENDQVQPGGPSAWVSPLQPPLRITGTFGEHRSGHLHTGMDFSTGGSCGEIVRAVGDGTVVRLRAGGGGYGRAIYLELSGGLLAVYGHLDHFARPLEDYLRDAQWARGEYEVDLYPEPGRFRFSAADTLAWSGETGSGPPHLHFEFRRGDEPVNPLDLGMVATDLLAPAIGPVWMRALSADAFAGDGVRATPDQAGGDPLRVWGRIGVECGVIDRSGTTGARLAPQEITLLLDGEVVFRRRFERLDFDRARDVERVYGRSETGAGRWSYRLYRWPPGSGSDQCADPALDGILDFSRIEPGMHALCIEAADGAGNQAEFSWTVAVAPRPVVECWRCAPDDRGGWLLGLRFAPVPRPGEPSGRGPGNIGEAGSEVGAEDRGEGGGEGGGQGRGEGGGAGGPSPRFPDSMRIVRVGASGQERLPWLALDHGWSSSHLQLPGAVEVWYDGRPALPPLWVGPPATDGKLEERAGLSLHFEEGFLGCEVFPPTLLPGIPRASLEGDGGRALPLQLRGTGPGGGWYFACGLEDAEGEWSALRLSIEDRPLGPPIPLAGLAVGGGRCAPASLKVPYAGLTLRPGADSFFGPTAVQAGIASLTGPSPAASDSGPVGAGVRVSASAEAGMEAQRLRALSPVLVLEPGWWPLQKPIELIMGEGFVSDGAEARRQGLYRLRNDGSWRWICPAVAEPERALPLAELGCYAVLADETAPRVWDEVPSAGAMVHVAPALVGARIDERGSGFEPVQADITFDGRMLLAVWDVDRGWLSAELDGPLAAGRHVWIVSVVDRAGNEGEKRFEFDLALR